jgi:predicted nucleic acid-binding protein
MHDDPQKAQRRRRQKANRAALLRGHRQLTDVYLLGLARHTGGTLATFDRTIPLGAVKGATRPHLQVIAPPAD